MKKHFTYESSKQIWRLLITDSDKLIMETRDNNTKEVFFNCFEIHTGKKIFTDHQQEEKYLTGIETIYKDVILFHKYFTPDLPGHKEIIAFDITTQKKLWSNSEYSFLFVYDDKVYCFKQGFEDRYFLALDYLNGNLLEEIGTDFNLINSLRQESENAKDWGHFIYPEVCKYDNELITKLIEEQTHKLEIIGEVEYGNYKNLIMISFHSKVFESSFINRFLLIDKTTGKIELSEILNANASSLLTDSFFVYKNFLILLKEKNGILIYNLE